MRYICLSRVNHMRYFLFFVICFLIVGQSFAQPYKTIKTFKPYKWMIAANWTGIEFIGANNSNSTDYSGSYTIQPYPTQLIIDRYFIYGWSMELDLTYAPSTLILETTDSTRFSTSSGVLASFDILGKYSFYNNYAPRARWIDPFLTFGIGYTYREASNTSHLPTVNLGAGVNFWIINQLGIRLSAGGKLGAYPLPWDESNIFIQYNAGIVFRTKAEKGNNSPSKRKKHKWAHKKQKFNNKKGGQ